MGGQGKRLVGAAGNPGETRAKPGRTPGAHAADLLTPGWSAYACRVMDQAARLALQDMVQGVVTPYLDGVLAEVSQLRSEVEALRRVAGPRSLRQAQVVRLRQEGLSLQAIAQAVDAHRGTIARDVRELGLPTPSSSIDINGVIRRSPTR